MDDLYHPPDVARASESWGANCGPAALAAACGLALCDVFEAVSDPPPAGSLSFVGRRFRGYMSIRQMREAVRSMGGHVADVLHNVSPKDFAERFPARWPDDRVLACVLWGGPWVGTRGEAVHRHWVALRMADPAGEGTGLWVYDVNAMHRVIERTYHGTESPPRWSEAMVVRDGGWLKWRRWQDVIPPQLMPKRGDGTFTIQWAGAVRAR